jgi:hypothetical protein
VLGLESLIWPSSIDFRLLKDIARGKVFILSRDAFLTFIKGDSGRKKRLLVRFAGVPYLKVIPSCWLLARFKVPKKKKPGVPGTWKKKSL